MDETVADLVELARDVLARPAAEGAVLVGVGVAVVGIVRREDGFVSVAPNLGWRDVPLGELLADALGLDCPVAVANEADLGALAEVRRGAATDAEHVLFISGEVGVGGGLIVDGEPFTGATGFGGEVGHMPVNPERRCLPLRLGGLLGDGGGRGRAPACRPCAGRRSRGGRRSPARGCRWRALCSRAFDTIGRWLGYGLATLINVFNPRLIVLGGPFGRSYPYTGATIAAELERLALRGCASWSRCVPATLGMDAPLLGAAELAFEPLLVDPQGWTAPRASPPTA